MRSAGRRVALVCLNPEPDEAASPEFPNFGVRRLQAALAAAEGLEDAEVFVLELSRPDLEDALAELAAFGPDIVGFTAYVWSFPFLVEVARALRGRCPRALILFGGPSARPEMFALAPFADACGFVDAIAIREGEETLVEIARARDRSPEALARVPGLALPRAGAFAPTAPRANIASLDGLPSPFALGLMPKGSSGYLETYRGCPMGCSFCEWGVTEWTRAGRVSSLDALLAELAAIARYRPKTLFSLDAGLNLDSRAFAVLSEAARRSGFFKDCELITEVYPSLMTAAHLEFLASCKLSYVGVGLQTSSQPVLDALGRPTSLARFDAVVRDLRSVAEVEIQVILGLPTDTPRSFRETLDRARGLGCNVRVYHCLVLPDALMTRADPGFRLEYDPVTLRMTSCAGWSRGDIEAESARMTDCARRESGAVGTFWWVLPGQGKRAMIRG